MRLRWQADRVALLVSSILAMRLYHRGTRILWGDASLARTPERTARGAARCRGYYLGTADQCARWDLPRSGIRQGDGPDSPAKGSGVSLLIAFKGPPGAGKSTIARALSKQLGWPLIDKDDVKDVLDG